MKRGGQDWIFVAERLKFLKEGKSGKNLNHIGKFCRIWPGIALSVLSGCFWILLRRCLTVLAPPT